MILQWAYIRVEEPEKVLVANDPVHTAPCVRPVIEVVDELAARRKRPALAARTSFVTEIAE